MEIPDVQYARSGEVSIASQSVGEGPVDVVLARGFASDLLSTWEQPLLLHELKVVPGEWRLYAVRAA